MAKIKLFLFIFLSGISAWSVYRAYLLWSLLGLSDTYVWNHYPGPCQLVEGVEIGSEDLELLPDGILLMSTGMMPRPSSTPDRAGQSTILMMDLNTEGDPQAGPADIIWADGKKPEPGFIVHGLSSWDLGDGRAIVFAVVHTKSGETVMRFQKTPRTHVLYHVDTIRAKHFVSLNDIVATGETSFYFTNSFYYHNNLLQLAEYFLQLQFGSVGYFDGQKSKLVDKGLNTANGIVASADLRSVFVAVTNDRIIIEYLRDHHDDLQRIKVLDVHTFPDNLYMDHSSGQLLVGCHPVPWMFLPHILDPVKNPEAPSQIISVQTDSGHLTDHMTEVLSSQGRDIAGSSVAVMYKNKLVVGTVMHKALLCHLPQ